jgi:hypothetical protein
MQQKGWKLTGSSVIDNLEYHYKAGELSNQLLNVIDLSNDAQTKLGDFRTSAQHPTQSKTSTTVDYLYDANGNLLKDFNKDIGTAANSGMAYNYLNLPQTVLFRRADGTVKGAINYQYTALGEKLKKTVTDNGVAGKTITTTTTYIAG